MNNYFLILVPFVLTMAACNPKMLAVNAVADALADGDNSVYARDDDPQLISKALPFALKLMESVLEATPEHEELLTATCASYTKYSHAFILWPAEDLDKSEYRQIKSERVRAKKIFLRARSYGFRALEIRHPEFANLIYKSPGTILTGCEESDVPALYWTAAAWVSALSTDIGDMVMVADLPLIEAMMERALELDHTYSDGIIHEFFITYDAGRPEAAGGGLKRAEEHFNQAMLLNKGKSVSPLLSYAQAICIPQQDRKGFEAALNQIMQFDPDLYPQHRLSNVLAQQRAKRLLNRVDHYFID